MPLFLIFFLSFITRMNPLSFMFGPCMKDSLDSSLSLTQVCQRLRDQHSCLVPYLTYFFTPRKEVSIGILIWITIKEKRGFPWQPWNTLFIPCTRPRSSTAFLANSFPRTWNPQDATIAERKPTVTVFFRVHQIKYIQKVVFACGVTDQEWSEIQ